MSLLVPAALSAGIVGLGSLVRSRHARRMEAIVAQRLPLNAEGIIAGAEPLNLSTDNGAVLILHGFGDTPQSIRAMAEHLHTAGWGIRAPLLPGHGRSLREFAAATAREWIDCARAEYEALHYTYGRVAIVGQSMGGALAMVLAAECPDVTALAVLAPYVTMLPKVARIARRARLMSLIMPYVSSKSEGSVWNPAERTQSLGYGVIPTRSLSELAVIVRAAWDAAPRVRAPTLMLQSRTDNRIDPEDAARVFDRLGGEPKELQWRTGSGHVLSVDYGRLEVFALVTAWLNRHGSRV